MGAEITPDSTMHVTELHRFANRRVKLGHHTYWDFPSLFAEMLTGIRKAVDSGHHIQSIAIDTWGVDFGLIDEAGCMLGLPVCYRDPSTAGFSARRAEIITDSEHYSTAGIQIMEINSIYRLMAMADEQPHMLQAASALLFMPDLFSYFLTGEANVEYSIASTSELLDARTRTWNIGLIRRLGLPERIFGQIVMPGTVRGHLTDDVRRQLGISYDVPVVAVGSHDTASAVYASAAALSPADTAYLSSGTWSLLGVLLDSPNLSEQARSAGFTNEGGVGGKIRFLQNITGLWILQCLVEQWRQRGLIHDYPALIAEAEKPGSETDARIDPDEATFANPSDME
ncbi:MAG: rhamnulokinase, partial [Muribaculaceae bacterium]|nr:rhamnulokinase [Muribaculaceae bacterium]